MRRYGSRVTPWVAWGFVLGGVLGGCGGIVDEQAEEQLQHSLGQTSITVLPTFIRDGEQERYDAEAARAVGDFLTEQKLATVTLSDAEVPITSKWGHNQAKMFRGSAADLTTYVKAHPIETDYALLTEYLLGGGGKVMGVHVYVVNRDGVVAYGALLNSHHKIFSDVNPQSAADCTTVVLNRLRTDWQR